MTLVLPFRKQSVSSALLCVHCPAGLVFSVASVQSQIRPDIELDELPVTEGQL